MLITTKGIVIREKSIGESDKYLDVLTEKLGVIEIKARGSKKMTAKSFASAQLYAYSEFCLRESKGKYYVDSTKPNKRFYGLREDIEKIALVVYFTDILKHTATDENEAAAVLRLFLLTLYYLESDKYKVEQIKSIFELKLMSQIGYEPDLYACTICDNDASYFSIENASLYCDKCKQAGYIALSPATLKAMQHIVNSPIDKVFNFVIKGDSLKQLSIITQRYVFYHLDMSFKSLDYYYKVKTKG